jgi:hypothetical protein
MYEFYSMNFYDHYKMNCLGAKSDICMKSVVVLGFEAVWTGRQKPAFR